MRGVHALTPLPPRARPCHTQVGEHTRHWAVGKVMVCDTSFLHETFNNTPQERSVLITRHWHPEVGRCRRAAAPGAAGAGPSRARLPVAPATQPGCHPASTLRLCRNPQVKPLERVAIQFLFDCLDTPTRAGIAAAQRKAEASLAASGAVALGAGSKGKKKAKAGRAKGGSAGGGGFGGGSKGFGAKA